MSRKRVLSSGFGYVVEHLFLAGIRSKVHPGGHLALDTDAVTTFARARRALGLGVSTGGDLKSHQYACLCCQAPSA